MPGVSEIFKQTILPLIVTYSPAILTLIVAWITLTQLYFRNSKDRVTSKNEAVQGENLRKNKKNVVKREKKKEEKHHQPRKDLGVFSHPWLLTSLKGHSNSILDMDFSPNGKYLATCSNDRAVFVWSTKDWKDREHKYFRYNIDYDHASLIKWSPDSKAVVYNRVNDNTVEVCKLSKKSDGSVVSLNKAITFPQMSSKEIIGLGIDMNGRYIMSASSSTDIFVWDLKGTLLTKLDTYLMNNYAAKVSPCGNFIVASGFAPDVKVWEVSFSKTGEFKQVSRAFELSGHRSGVVDFDLSADSSNIVTISKDGSWRLYNTKIEYSKGEEAHLMKSGEFKYDSSRRARIALSPSADVIALVVNSDLTLINAHTGLVDNIIKNIYQGQIEKILFDAGGDYVLTGGEKHVRVFYNVTVHKARIDSARSKLGQAGLSQATRERLLQTIATSQQIIETFI